ncbi:MAG: hypothetical protein C0404_06545 [Verrucomicrobia bacterium]|nr:hypothetical protein [Verrucomicrobiota bacterium]
MCNPASASAFMVRNIPAWQVIQEFMNVATRKFSRPLTIPGRKQYLTQDLFPLWTYSPDPTR